MKHQSVHRVAPVFYWCPDGHKNFYSAMLSVRCQSAGCKKDFLVRVQRIPPPLIVS